MWKEGGNPQALKQEKLTEITETLGALKLFSPRVSFLRVSEGLGAPVQSAGGDAGLCPCTHTYHRRPWLSTMK